MLEFTSWIIIIKICNLFSSQFPHSNCNHVVLIVHPLICLYNNPYLNSGFSVVIWLYPKHLFVIFINPSPQVSKGFLLSGYPDLIVSVYFTVERLSVDVQVWLTLRCYLMRGSRRNRIAQLAVTVWTARVAGADIFTCCCCVDRFLSFPSYEEWRMKRDVIYRGPSQWDRPWLPLPTFVWMRTRGVEKRMHCPGSWLRRRKETQCQRQPCYLRHRRTLGLNGCVIVATWGIG